MSIAGCGPDSSTSEGAGSGLVLDENPPADYSALGIDFKAGYTLPGYRYIVGIDGMDPIAFSEILGRNIPGQRPPVVITMKKGVAKGNSRLYDWMNSSKFAVVDKKGATISLMDGTGQKPLVSWKVINAFPTKLDTPTFNATSNEVAIETLELGADGFSLEYP